MQKILLKAIWVTLALTIMGAICFLPSAAFAAEGDDGDFITPVPGTGGVGERPVWSAQGLLKPDILPDAQFGMYLESAEDGPVAKVITTGGEFIINKSADTIECKQRIAAKRTVAVLKFAKGTLTNIKLTHKSSGAAIFEGDGSVVRINGDSLLMAQPSKSGNIKGELAFTPDYHSDFVGNYNFFDPYGGISFFEHGKCPNADLQAFEDPVTVTWPWKGGDVLWAAVSPPKPFDWDASYKARVYWTGSELDRRMYPPDDMLRRLKEDLGTNIIHLHNELMWDMTKTSWVSGRWDRPLKPRDEKEYLRVMRTCKELGIGVTVYATPFYTGGNENLYLKQAKRLVDLYETKGLYFDETYRSLPWMATAYHFARASRQLVGDDGLIIYHGADDVPMDRREREGEQSGKTYCPMIHTYYNIVFRGEGEFNRWGDDYVRYRLSTYNISNSIGSPVLDTNHHVSKEKIDFWLRKGNIRLWQSRDINLLRDYYWPRMNPNLRAEIEPGLLKPTGAFQRFRDSIKYEAAHK